jgi:hypothetical protein
MVERRRKTKADITKRRRFFARAGLSLCQHDSIAQLEMEEAAARAKATIRIPMGLK